MKKPQANYAFVNGTALHLTRISLLMVSLICVSLIAGCASSQPESALLEKTPAAPSLEKVIKDLDHVTLIAMPYNDDPDPMSEGLAIFIGFSDSKDQSIEFEETPLTVTIQLHGYKKARDTFDHEKMELVYQKQVTMNRSMKFTEFADNIKIPFEDITVDSNSYYEYGTIEVTVTTPKQGEFRDIYDRIQLYSAQPVIAPPEGTITPPARLSEKIISDLASISVLALPYNDDLDIWDDGISLDILFKDSKSNLIAFQETPITVTIQLYGYKEWRDSFYLERGELVYQQDIIIDHSPRSIDMYPGYILIPFENIMVDSDKYHRHGTIKVTVTTPMQGDFQDIMKFVDLYHAQPVIAPPQGTITTPAPSSERIIKDLDHVSIRSSIDSSPYVSADSLNDGISLSISFEDSKNNSIAFQEIPLTVTIQLYAGKGLLDYLQIEERTLVYYQQIVIDRSMREGESPADYIWIPFENIMVDSNKYHRQGTIKVTITTPVQDDFQDMHKSVPLYAKD